MNKDRHGCSAVKSVASRENLWPIILMLRFLSQLIRLVVVNRVSLIQRDGVNYIEKQRWPLCTLLIIPGNWVFWFRRTPVRVLPTQKWMRWEVAVAQTMERPEPKIAKRSLEMPQWSGQSLPECWANREMTLEERLKQVTLAVDSLRQLHQRSIATDSRSIVSLSHGDATVRNVMYDAKKRTATWFDFDLRHDLSVCATARHADDLRAFLFSAAYYFAIEDLPDLVNVTRDNYDDVEAWDALSKQVSGPWFRFDLFQLAHTRPPGRLNGQPNSWAKYSLKQQVLIRSICN